MEHPPASEPPPPVPQLIHHLVTDEGGRLRVKLTDEPADDSALWFITGSAVAPTVLMAVALVLLLVLMSVFSALATLLAAYSPLVGGVAMLVVLLVSLVALVAALVIPIAMITGGTLLGGSMLLHEPSLWVRSDGVRRPGALRRGRAHTEALALVGDAGRPVQLCSGDRVLATFSVGTPSSKWGFDDVTWLAQRITAITGQPVADRRPRDAWAAWLDKQRARVRKQFLTHAEANSAAYPQHHVTPPDEPDGEVDVHGRTVWLSRKDGVSVRLSRDGLHTGDRVIHFGHIDGVRVTVFTLTETIATVDVGVSQVPITEESLRARIDLLIGHRIVPLPSIRAERVGDTASLAWLADELTRLAYAHTDATPHALGAADDVPEALRALADRRRAEPAR